MPRPPISLGHDVDAEIAARTARGESAETVAAALGGKVSVRTIRRRQVALRGKPAAAPPAAPEAPETDEVPKDVPEGTPLETIEAWIKRVEKALDKAEKDGNLTAISSLVMRLTSLAEARRKATPLPKADPNEAPDTRQVADRAWKRLEALLNDLPELGAS